MGVGHRRFAPSPDALRRIPRQYGHGRVLLRQPIFALVLGAAIKLLTNPIFLRMAAVFFTAVFAFVVALLVMRRSRKGLIDEDFSLATPRESERLPLHTYHAIIQQLKQQ